MDCSILGLIVGLLVMEPTTFFPSKPCWNFPVVTRRRSASALLNMGGGYPSKPQGDIGIMRRLEGHAEKNL